jgi:hypothetical protein
VEGGWRRLHNEELHNLCTSTDVIRVIKLRRMRRAAKHETRMRLKINAYKTLVGKREENRPLGRRICRWDDNIRMDRREVGWEYVDRIHLAQNRIQRRAVMNTVTNIQVP